jgi:hypothetical protein
MEKKTVSGLIFMVLLTGVLTSAFYIKPARGVHLWEDHDNKIYHNDFINKAGQALSYESSNNTWDNRYPSGSNRWSDYSRTGLFGGLFQNETGSDGIGDTPNVIDENDKDKYPFFVLTSPIIINESQTWYGDLTVDQSETLIIENCNFTVVEGSVIVYGRLYFENCSLLVRHQQTLWLCEIFVAEGALLSFVNSDIAMRSSSIEEWLVSFGSLSFTNSVVIGYIYIWVSNGDLVVIGSEITDLYLEYGGRAQINNSSLYSITCYSPCQATIKNSTIIFNSIVRGTDAYETQLVCYSESNLTKVHLLFYSANNPLELYLPTGLVGRTTICSEEKGWNYTFSDCFIDSWRVHGQSITLHDSTIEELGFSTGKLSEPIELVLEKGHIENKWISINSEDPPQYTVSISVENSTINMWEANIWGAGEINISNSYTTLDVSSNASVIVLNSTLPWLEGGSNANSSVHVMDSTVTVVYLGFNNETVDLTLHDGHYEQLTFYSEVTGSNLTLERTVVQHWSIVAYGNQTVHLYDSILSRPPQFSGYPTANRFMGNAKVYFYNSTLNGTVYCEESASFTLMNSTLYELWAQDDCNITLINSTVYVLITDPPIIYLLDSTVFTEIRLSSPVYPDFISASILEEVPIALPGDTLCVGKCLQVECSFSDLAEMQIRICYDEEQVRSLEANESDLSLYFLDACGGNWSLCPIQGINANDNYVWANVTHFSYFVLGVPSHYYVGEVTFSKTIVGKGCSLTVNWTVVNGAGHEGCFNVTLNVNTALLDSTECVLNAGESIDLSFVWNTTETVYGTYKIGIGLNGTQLMFTVGTVVVTIPGDVDGDFENGHYDVDLFDAVKLLAIYGAKLGDSNFDPNCDIDDSGQIFLFDAVILLSHYGEKYP